MQHALVPCQPDSSRGQRAAKPEPEPAPGNRKRWVADPAETVEHTMSRRSGPRAWLRALEGAVAAGLVPGFTESTQRIVDVLAGRMCFDSGHARYVMTDVMERTGLGRTAVTSHVRLLRAAGWLAWAVHGSRRNALRSRSLPGYARTATVYAATIPPQYDAHVGNNVVGAGYQARVIVDHGINSLVENGSKTPVENSCGKAARTPSLWWVKEVGKVQVVGGEDGSTASAAASESPRRKKRRLTVTGYKITGPRVERARQIAKSVRPLVNWMQRSTLDELSWVLLDLVARDWSEPRIVRWLHHLGQELGVPRWRPRTPHRVIAAALGRMAHQDARSAVPADLEHEEYLPQVGPNTAFQQAADTVREHLSGAEPPESVDGCGENDEVVLTAWELALLREAARADPALVLAYARIRGRDAAVATYGTMATAILDTPAAYIGFRPGPSTLPALTCRRPIG
ncbi:hypothetical protein ABZX77_15015 [Streptomyces sp. NPDC004237]|uniref:hypothetical protein n=1 Tax=Streptomyces sp. NPDC004237 TaxID=3154455 RepID=UPI00339E918D